MGCGARVDDEAQLAAKTDQANRAATLGKGGAFADGDLAVGGRTMGAGPGGASIEHIAAVGRIATGGKQGDLELGIADGLAIERVHRGCDIFASLEAQAHLTMGLRQGHEADDVVDHHRLDLGVGL